jgi:hypothetical protein
MDGRTATREEHPKMRNRGSARAGDVIRVTRKGK